MDETLRQKERRAGAEAGPEADASLLRERMRAGQISREEVIDRASNNDPIALAVLGVTMPQARLLQTMQGRTRPRNTADAARAIRAYYQATGFTPDRFGALVGQSGGRNVRLVFKPRVVEEYSGRPGNWVKRGSRSLIEHAEALLASAHGEAGKEAFAERVEAKKVKAKARRTAEEIKRNTLRAAAVILSIDLTPEDRLASIMSSQEFERAAIALSTEVESQIDQGVTAEQIDAMLSSSTPPIFLPTGRRGDHDWPTSYSWRDKDSDFDVEVKRKPGNQSISIMIGNIPVDPITGNFSPTARIFDKDEEGYTGLAGRIKVGIFEDDAPQAQLYMIQSAKPRQGTARRMIRLFCRLVRSYGFDHFVVLGVNENSAALILGLDREDEIKIVGRTGNNVFVKCTEALGDPRQERLFGPPMKRNRPMSVCSSCVRRDGLPACDSCGWRTCRHRSDGGTCHWCKRTGGVDPMTERYRRLGKISDR